MYDKKESSPEKQEGLKVNELRSFTLDVNTGTVTVNGTEVKDVFEIYLRFKDGQYLLEIARTDLLKGERRG